MRGLGVQVPWSAPIKMKGISRMELNFLAIGLAALAGILIGAFWFSPVAFFPLWWKFLGRKPDDQPGTSNMAVIFGTTFLAAGLQAVVLAVVIGLAESALGPFSFLQGAAIGSLMGVGFAAASSISHQLFGGFSVRAWVLEVGQDIVSLTAMGAIIASF